MPTTCKFPGCTKNAKYGYSKEDKKKFCKPHYVNVGKEQYLGYLVERSFP